MAFINAFYQQHKGKGLPKCTMHKAPVWALEKLLKISIKHVRGLANINFDSFQESVHWKFTHCITLIQIIVCNYDEHTDKMSI
jgi:hypothetical protein